MDKTTDENFIGYINPLRYRGYYYDTETSIYYLNARYYDPEVGRFINADGTLSGGYNLFEYCHNNPITFYDPNGCAPMGPGHQHGGFATMDEAAIDWAYYYHVNFAMRDGIEYIGNIIIADNGKYYYEDAVPGGDTNAYLPDTTNTRVAWIHSHHNHPDPRALIFAIDDEVISEDLRIPGYVVTPAGDIQKYEPIGNFGGDPYNQKAGKLSWIYYDWKQLSGSNGFKDYRWGIIPVKARDIRLHFLRVYHGSITGRDAYVDLFNLMK